MKIIDNSNRNEKYAKALKRVKELKKFHKHLAAYIIVNLFLILIRMVRDHQDGDSLEIIFSSIRVGSLWFWWGIGLAIHAFKTFGYDIFFGKNWEEKKIKELMDNC